MKKATRIICFILSMVMIFGAFGMLIACPTKPIIYTVTFVNGTTTNTAKVEKGSSIADSVMPTDPIPYKTATEDKVFIHWSADGASDFGATKVNGDITLTAVFRDRAANEVIAHFDTDGAGRIKTQYLTVGGTITKPANPTKKGASFDKWVGAVVDGNGNYDFTKPVTSDAFVKATWIESNNHTLVLSSAAFDNVFSPFFSTSAYDGSVHSMTQISMLSTNHLGQPYVGEDVPTLVKDYSETTTYKRGDTWIPASEATPDEIADIEHPKNDELRLSGDYYKTEYQFVIKNGVKDSENKELGIKDVLFNMYLYLDPMYTGSNTLYSTNILGLNQYRNQDPNATAATKSADESARGYANERIANIAQYFDKDGGLSYRDGLSFEEEKQIIEDVAMLRGFFWDELVSDWNSVSSLGKDEDGFIEGYAEYNFKNHWEVFLLNCSLISAEYDKSGKVDQTKHNPPQTEKGIIYGNTRDFRSYKGIDLIKYVFNNYAGVYLPADFGSILNGATGELKVDYELDAAHKRIGEAFPIGNDASARTNPETLMGRIRNGQISANLNKNATILTYYWQCGQKLYSEIVAMEKSKIISQVIGDGDRKVDTIEGIKVGKVREFTNKDGELKQYDKDHYVLKITIGGVDPKAIWNFGITVAPMWYYSDPSDKGAGMNDLGYTRFSYPGVDGHRQGEQSHLGFGQLNYDYFQKVLRHQSVIAVPVGAGPFKASDATNTPDNNIPLGTGFESNGIVYFKRNLNFKTTGSAMNNAKFEYLRYQVVDTTRVLESVRSGVVHYGDPAAKEQNYIAAVNAPNLNVELIDNMGYGYVGVSARWVPNVYIRRAIMTAFDTSKIGSYYPSNFASIIIRPMSTVSPYYPEIGGVGSDDEYYKFGSSKEDTIAKVKALVTQSGYSKATTPYSKTINGAVNSLKYVFTVAGSSDDHPAYAMFAYAAQILNECGFEITVKNDPQALQKLGNGELHVWAAAWSSSIDPDMYQVYHYNSQATSINNWGFPYIIANQTEDSSYEYSMLLKIAKGIEAGRSTTDFDTRVSIYTGVLEDIMDLAVEYPTYQRKNMVVYDKTKIDETTVFQDPTAFRGLIDQIWKISLLK